MKLTDKSFLPLFLLVVGIVIIECIAQYCLKKCYLQQSLLWFVLGIIIYVIIVYILLHTYKYEKLAIINVMWGGLSALILTLAAFFFFDERLTLLQILGIIIIVIGIGLLHTS